MNTRRYQVIFTGRCVAGLEEAAVISNLVLDVGVSEQKARSLLRMHRVVLKRFAMAGDAQKMVTKLERAGLVCAIEEIAPAEIPADGAGAGESTLVSFLSKFSPLRKK
jgi:hypothetical protein